MYARSVLYTLLALLIGTTTTQAQIERTADAAVADIRDGVMDHPYVFFFEGCPQQDPIGREIVAAVGDLELTTDAVFDLSMAFAWNGAYPDCNYEPLNAWFVRAFERMQQRRDEGAVQMFLSSLPQTIANDLQVALLSAAEDDAFRPELRSRLADAAIFKRPPDRQPREAVAAFQRDLPRDWIASATHRLGQRNGAAFFTAIDQAAPNLSDRVMEIVGGAIAGDIRDGHVEARQDSLDRLRAHLRTRALPPWAQLPTNGR